MDYDEAIRRAGRSLAEACARRDSLPARQAAIEAHEPGGLGVDALERLIVAERSVGMAA